MAIDLVLSSDTPNAGRVKWNGNDTELSGRIDDADAALTTHKSSDDHDGRNDGRYDALGSASTVNSALTTHKSSDDHDGRYYTKSEILVLVKRQPFCVHFAWSASAGKFYVNNIEVNASMGVPIDRTGCLMKILRVKGDGSIEATTGSFDVDSDRFFSGHRRLSFSFEGSGTILMPTIDGIPVNTLALSTSDNNDIQGMLYGEYA